MKSLKSISMEKIIPDIKIPLTYSSFIGAVTPAKLSSMLEALDRGAITDAMIFFDEMREKDIHLGAVTQTRVLAAVSRRREVVAASTQKDDIYISDFIRDIFEHIPNIHITLISMMSAITHGFSMAEIIYQYDNSRIVIEDLSIHPQRMFSFSDDENPNSLFNFPRYIDFENKQYIDLPKEKFIFHKNIAGEHPVKGGLYRGLAWTTIFSNYTLKDWMTFLDLYGIPLRLGKYKPSAGKEAVDILKQAVRGLGADAAAVISDETSIEFISSQLSGSHSLFMDAAEFFNKQKSKRILGQTLTTESEKSGSYALGKTHERVREAIVDFDVKSLDATLNKDLVKPLVDANFGIQKRYPKIMTNLTTQDDIDIKLDRIKKMVELGAKIPAKILSQITGIHTDDSDEYLNIK